MVIFVHVYYFIFSAMGPECISIKHKMKLIIDPFKIQVYIYLISYNIDCRL